ncbi:MAG: UbiD family decarboxylase domain-containing protein [Candidatus Binatia bacterium]
MELVRCETVDVEVPAAAEIILEGKMPSRVREPEGPFGEWHGYYTGEAP